MFRGCAVFYAFSGTDDLILEPQKSHDTFLLSEILKPEIFILQPVNRKWQDTERKMYEE